MRAGSKDIELWRGMFSQEVIRDAEGWRDKALYRFNPEDIVNIEVVEGKNKKTLSIADSDSIWKYTENGKPKPVDQYKIRNILEIISKLRCDKFASGDDIPKASAKKPEIRVNFTVRNGDRHSFEVWKPDKEKENYLARKINGDILYVFYPYRAASVILDYEKIKPEN
jgi:hypothetical protein